MLLKPFDFGVLISACGAVLASFVFAYSGADTRYTIRLKGAAVPGGDAGGITAGAEWVFPQDADEIVRVAGPLGDTVVAIKNGAAAVLSSPCANQTCVAAGVIRHRGQWTACLPNKVMVFIEGAEGGAAARNPADASPSGRNTSDVDAAAW